MAGISFYDSSSISTLFSSLNSSKTQGGSDLLGINYSDYASIRSGSYGKLVRAYYAMDSDKSTGAKTNSSTSTSKDSEKTLAGIEADAQALTDSAKKLYTGSGNTVFKKDAQGNYDVNAIYNAVNDFAEDYNSLLSSGEKSNTSSIDNALSSMKSSTDANEKTLNDIGISIDGKTGKLTVDEKKFKSADMDKVKALFKGTGSYGYRVATQASMIDSYAKTEASKANTYNQSGKYNYNYNSGNIFYDGF